MFPTAPAPDAAEPPPPPPDGSARSAAAPDPVPPLPELDELLEPLAAVVALVVVEEDEVVVTGGVTVCAPAALEKSKIQQIKIREAYAPTRVLERAFAFASPPQKDRANPTEPAA